MRLARSSSRSAKCERSSLLPSSRFQAGARLSSELTHPRRLGLIKWPIIPKHSTTAMASDFDAHLPLEIDAVSPLNNTALLSRLTSDNSFLSCQLQISVHLSLISCHALPPNRRPLTRKFSVDVFNWLPPSLSQTLPWPRILNAAYPPGPSVFVVWLISL